MVVSSLLVKVLGGRGSSPCRWLTRFRPISPPFGLRLRTEVANEAGHGGRHRQGDIGGGVVIHC